ncbi:porin [Limnohabitans sp. DCL3]|uniref:porin n=1 Tax=Limnohabitans sp. DCL3 TaxID=3374103 RepID=UPI003A8676C3
MAAVSGTAFAQSTVTLSGSLGLTFGNVEYGGAPTRQDIGRASGAITLAGTEDLGGGLNASFVVQQGMYGWTTAGGAASTSLTGNSLGNFGDRQMFATVSGGFGTVKIGRDLTGGSTAPLGAGKVDGTRAITGMDDNKADAVYFGNVRATSLAYITPNISGFNAYVGITPQNYGGLTAGSASTTVTSDGVGILAVATPAAASTKPDSSTGYGLTYANGPVSAALDVSKFEETVPTLGNNATVTSMGASYDLGVAKVGAVYQTIKGDAKANTKSNIVSVSVPLGAVTLGAAVGKRNATATGAFSAVETKHSQVSASYALSKRTVVYFAHSDKNVAGAAVNANDAKETGVGIAHTF